MNLFQFRITFLNLLALPLFVFLFCIVIIIPLFQNFQINLACKMLILKFLFCFERPPSLKMKTKQKCAEAFSQWIDFTVKTYLFAGFALGSIEGRVAISYANVQNPKDNFTFKCHRSNGVTNGFQDIYAVNDIAFHPVHGKKTHFDIVRGSKEGCNWWHGLSAAIKLVFFM